MIMARWKIITNLVICLIGVLLALPNVLSPDLRKHLPTWMSQTVNLGLELRGGSHLQFEVDLNGVRKEIMTTLLEDVRTNLRKEQIGYTGLVIDQQKGKINVSLREPKEYDKASQILKKIDPELEVKIDANGLTTIGYSESYYQRRMHAVVEQSQEVIRRRVDESGMKEPNVLRQGNDRIIVQLPGIDDPAEMKKLIGKTAKLTFRLVDYTAGPISIGPNGNPVGNVPPGSEILEDVSAHNKQDRFLVVKKQVMVSGENLVDSQATKSEGVPAVALKFNSPGAAKFARASAENLNRQFAVVLDNKVISAPVFRAVIPDGNGVISSPHFTLKEASDLALLLRAGALPAPLKIVEERTVGPSLGEDSISDGKIATTLAIVFVAIFMILNYSLFGVFADIALIFNIILLFAVLSLLQATLTLPGIAGIALTVGIAVDANVLIYERIKEEVRHGIRPVAAVEAGYRRAVMTIIDSNLTTLIGTAVLFEFGSGPIRGFAVSLAIGILLSLFTTLGLNRMTILYFLKKKRPQSLPI